MKHLDVLVGAGLGGSRRKGRVRWNHLNAVPLQQMYEHWVRPYEAVWATSLIRFKDATEHSHQEKIMPAPPTALPQESLEHGDWKGGDPSG